jgi:hypothetical protein
MMLDRVSAQTISFQEETLSAVRADLDALFPILQRHYQEIAQFKEVQQLDPDWEAYEKADRAGKLWIMTARDHGRLVGYIVMLLAHDMHYRTLRRATEDIHFILPEYRRGLLGYRMLRWTLDEMRAKSIQMVKFRTKANHSHAALFERLGGELEDLVYTFVL